MMKTSIFFSKAVFSLLFILFSVFSFAQNVGDYRSVASGNWNDPAIWQVCTSLSPTITWGPAAQFPGQTGGNYSVTISVGTTVNVITASTYTIGDLHVEGTLELKANFTLNNFTNPSIKTIGIKDGRIIIGKSREFRLPANTVFSMDLSDSTLYGLHGEIKGKNQKEDCDANTAVMIFNNDTGLYDRYTTCVGRPGTTGMNFAEFNSRNSDLIVSTDGGNSYFFCKGENTGSTLIANLYSKDNLSNPLTSGVTYKWLYFPPGSSIAIDPSPNSTTHKLTTPIDLSEGQHYYRLIFTYKFGNPTKTIVRYVDFVVNVAVPTEWNGIEWTYGTPSENYKMKAIIGANYNTKDKGSITACSCEVNIDATLTIADNGFLDVQDEIINNGKLIVKHGGNVIQRNPNIINSTAINVRRLHNLSTARREYNFLSSPVAGQNMKAIFGNNTAYVKDVHVYNEATNYFEYATQLDYGIKAKGFSVEEPLASYYGSGDIANNESEYIGYPNNGNISIPVSRSTAARGYNLVGNPYPSNIDIVELYKNNSSVLESTFRFWDNSVNNTYVQMGSLYEGYSYALFNAAAGIDGFGISAAVVLDKSNAALITPHRIVEIGQGFLVRATDLVRATNSGSLNFQNNIRRKTKTSAPITSQNSFKLELETASEFVLQNGFIYFEGGNNDFGVDDTRIPTAVASDILYSWVGTTRAVINGRNTFSQDDVIKLGIKGFKTGPYNIKAVDRKGVFAGSQKIYLKDKELNNVVDLTALTEGYSFNLNKGEFGDRFEILYKNETGTQSSNQSGQEVFVYKEGEEFVVKSLTVDLNQVEVYDGGGRMLKSKGGNGSEIRINSEKMNQGFYIFKITTKNKEVLLRKARN